MSFVGLITKKDKPSGVKLKAKIVTPNKKKYAEKIFNVKIKENAISDITCCVIDHETIVNKITKSQDMNSINSDLTLIYNGDNGTIISYSLEKINVPYIDNYIREDGKFLGKPKYGEEDSKGFLKVTVSKGEETIQSSIEICVKAYTVDEVFADERLTTERLWNEYIAYGTKNKSYQNNNIVKYKINLPSKITVSDKSIIDIQLAWEVEDKTLDIDSNTYYTESRINYNDKSNIGELNTYSYAAACKIVNAIESDSLDISWEPSNKPGESLQNCMIIGGIVLKASLTIQQNEDSEIIESLNNPIIYNCSTYSEQISNKEVEQIVLNNLELIVVDPDNGEQFMFYDYELNDIIDFTINATDTNKTSFQIKTNASDGTSYFNSSSLYVEQGALQGIQLSTNFRTLDGEMDHSNQSAFDKNMDEQHKYDITTINLESFKDLPEKDKQFTLCFSYTITGYSGESIIDKYLYKQFKIDTSALS